MPNDKKLRHSTGDRSATTGNLNRRTLLGGLACATTVGTSGCMEIFTDGSLNRFTDTPEQTGPYTTVEKTKTFSYRGTRTPFPGVEAIYAGESSGTLVIAYFDYSHDASLTWWREEFPELIDLIDDGRLRLTLMMFPKPIDRWSVMLPSALFEVRSRTSREATWKFHEGLVSADEYSMELLENLADKVGVDTDGVTAAAEDRRRRNQTFSDKAMGEDSGVGSLPAFRWGMERIEGTSADAIRGFVENRNS